MSNFVVRIELHHASEAQYASLHIKMKAAGYRRSIRGSNGVNYQLPTATYARESYEIVTAEAVRKEVSPIAQSIVPSAWTLVLRYDEAAWTLPPAAAAA